MGGRRRKERKRRRKKKDRKKNGERAEGERKEKTKRGGGRKEQWRGREEGENEGGGEKRGAGGHEGRPACPCCSCLWHLQHCGVHGGEGPHPLWVASRRPVSLGRFLLLLRLLLFIRLFPPRQLLFCDRGEELELPPSQPRSSAQVPPGKLRHFWETLSISFHDLAPHQAASCDSDEGLLFPL